MSDDTLMNGANGALPEYLKGVAEDKSFGEGMDGGGYPRLAFKSNRHRLRHGGEETILPETELEVVIIDEFPAVSRIYYGSSYDPDAESHPLCASADGEAPLANAAKPQAAACADCPMNEVGSATTDDGRKSRACSFFKRLVVVIKGYEDVGPVVTDIRAMSLFGDSYPDKNLWSLKTYFQRLKRNQTLPFQIVTKVSFDLESSVPKVLFEPVGWVDKATFEDHIATLINTPDGIQQLEDMRDTSKVRFEGEASGGSAFRDRLLADDKPAHLEAPKEEAEPEPAPSNVTELSPQQKAAKTRAANKKKAEEEEAAAKAAEQAADEATPAPTEPQGNKAEAELEAALGEFDF